MRPCHFPCAPRGAGPGAARPGGNKKRLPKPSENSHGLTPKLPTLVPKEATSVSMRTFFTSALSSQPPPTGTSRPACSARPKLFFLTDGPSAVATAGEKLTLEKRV